MREPRRVMHVMNAAAGGAALSTVALIGALKARGIESSVVCHAMGTDDEKRELEAAVEGRATFVPLYWWNKKIRAASWKRPLLELRQQANTGLSIGSTAAVTRAAVKFRAELIHTNTLLNPEGARAAQVLGLPHVWHVRELIGEGHPFQLGFGNKRLSLHLNGHASRVVANSRASASTVAPFVEPSRLEVIHNGIALAALLTLSPKPSPVPVVVMLANLTSRTKRHELFLEAARRLKGKALFRLYGHPGGEGDAHADRLKALAKAHGAEVMGFAPPELALAEAHVLVQPAENESFGRTVVEAMAAGLPVVGARGGGVGELVEEDVTGLTFTPLDGDALVAALDRLLASAALRERLGKAGRVRAKAEFSIEACAEKVSRAYSEAMRFPLRPPWEGFVRGFR